jgi:hypothetical protein
VSFLIPKLYTLTVLSSLNARPVLRDWSNNNVTMVDRDNQMYPAKVKTLVGSSFMILTDTSHRPNMFPQPSTTVSSVPRCSTWRRYVIPSRYSLIDSLSLLQNTMKKSFPVDVETAPRMTLAHSPAASLATTVGPSEALPIAPVPLHVAQHNRSRSNTRDGMSRPSAELLRARTPPPTRAPTDSLPPPPLPAKLLSSTGQPQIRRPSVSERGQSDDEHSVEEQQQGFEPPAFPLQQRRARSNSLLRLAEPRPGAF